MNTRTAQRGLTLIELVASIVIISVATIGLMAAVTAAVGRSADPMIQNQATAIGVAYMEEITLAPLCDPAYNPDGNASTTCRRYSPGASGISCTNATTYPESIAPTSRKAVSANRPIVIPNTRGTTRK